MNPSSKYKDISKFDRDFLSSDGNLFYIGEGSLGGKASGLSIINNILKNKFNTNEFPEILVSLPRMIVLRTGIFLEFIEQNNLKEFALNEESDVRIVGEFLRANLPTEILGDLHSIIDKIHVPLAIRSSSLLEDAKYEPFAGIYATKMIPNNNPSNDIRFQRLVEAIKFVFASTYFKASKDYFKSSSRNIEEEKMAVIIQEVIGENHNNRFYPHISGVARSYNFYPFGRSKQEDGVVNLALGLGKTIVDGGIVWSYSPEFPASSSFFGNPKDMLKFTQTNFWAINLNPVLHYDPTKETEYLIGLNLKDAEYDNTIKYSASTYSESSDRIVLGTGTDGPRVLNFGVLLEFDDFGFNQLMKNLMKICTDEYKNPVEIEFALTISKESKKMNFGFLQVRPMVVSNEIVDVDVKELFGENVLLASDRVMGNGTNENINDIVFVKPESFDKKNTLQIAKEIDQINKKIVSEKSGYLLIGFGRWGSSDPWLGIPVEWGQIGGAKAIVESTLFEINVDLSQGSHFFHNLNSFNVSYFSINFDGRFKIDWDWLNSQEIVVETEHIKHVKLNNPLMIKVDGRKGNGVILKSIPEK